MQHGRSLGRIVVASALATVGLTSALAQQPRSKPVTVQTQDGPVKVEMRPIPVNPSDPIAVINGEPITRQQLADECVVRKGEEVLEAMIARKLIDQAIRAKGVQVTQAEVDAEIERIAMSVAGVSREQWLATLSKERKISPAQYARDVIYPMLAMRKLAEPRVQVTDEDIKDGFEAKYGDRLRCRMIMFNDVRQAMSAWEELKKNPGLFEKLAQEKSIDPSTAAVGGMLPQPMTRHAYPRPVSDAAFKQLVDVEEGVDPKDPNYEKYKPKDGDISGIIQVNEATWIILKREGVIPAQPYDPNNQAERDELKKALFDAKLQDEVGTVWGEIMRQSAIENRLTGHIKPSGADRADMGDVDDDVRRTAGPSPTAAQAEEASKLPTPAGLSASDARAAESLKKTTEATPAPAATTTAPAPAATTTAPAPAAATTAPAAATP